MKRNVWILNHYAGIMLGDKGGRHYWFSKYLKRAGYCPTIFCCNTKHNIPERYIDTENLWIEQRAEEIDVPFVFVRSNIYKGNDISRIRNMFIFYANLLKTAKDYVKSHEKPDIIYASSVHPLTLIAGIKLAKEFGVKCICEMRDLWPEAIVAYSKRIKREGFLAKALYSGERWIYEHADALIFTQEGGPDYVCQQGWDTGHGGKIDLSKAFHINNGVDLEAFDKNAMQYKYPDKDMDAKDTIKIVYTGAVRRINNLAILVDAASFFDDERMHLIVFGDGDELESLKLKVQHEGLTNVHFKGRVDKQFIPSILRRSDINVVHWEMNPLVSVGESYNKAFEYYAAGKPVFYTIHPGYSIAERYHAGYITDSFDTQSIGEGINDLVKLSDDERQAVADNARHVAELYDFKVLTKELINIIENI